MIECAFCGTDDLREVWAFPTRDGDVHACPECAELVALCRRRELVERGVGRVVGDRRDAGQFVSTDERSILWRAVRKRVETFWLARTGAPRELSLVELARLTAPRYLRRAS